MPFPNSVRADGSECVDYPEKELDIFIGGTWLSRLPQMRFYMHWHDDWEFSWVLHGHMAFTINGEAVVVHAGEGIFINSRQLHVNYSADGSDCEYRCVLIHPSAVQDTPFLSAEDVRRIQENSAFSWQVMRIDVPWQEAALRAAFAIHEHMREKARGALSMARLQAVAAMTYLFYGMPRAEGGEVSARRQLPAMTQMIAFIRRRYAERVTIGEIAAAGNVSVSTCYELFHRFAKLTPLNYLTQHRLKMAMDILRETDAPVTEVALSVGFSGASYFTECFRRHVGETPSGFRKRVQG